MTGRRKHVQATAVDRAGFPRTCASQCHLSCKNKRKDRLHGHLHACCKAGLLADTSNHLVPGIHCSRGPSAGPSAERDALIPGVERRSRDVVILRLLANAGSDSAGNHAYLRDDHGIDSTIPT